MNRKGFTIVESLVLFQLAFVLSIIVCWIINLVKLVNCDFASPYKEEIIHAIGLIPPASLVTVWF